jgi:hypothetical protein
MRSIAFPRLKRCSLAPGLHTPGIRRIRRIAVSCEQLKMDGAGMEKRKFRIGDRVKVVGMSPVIFAPGVKDELGTEKLFKSTLGKVYTVRGVDKYGNAELEPKRLNTVWVEPEFLKLRASARRKRKHGPKS